MPLNNIRRVLLTICGCGLMSVQSGNCENPSESGASLPAGPSANMMQGSLGRPTPAEQNFEPEFVELYLGTVERAPGVQFVLKKLCPGATPAGERGLIRMLVANLIGTSPTQGVSNVNIIGFPCTSMLEILKMESAHPDLIPLLGYSHREAADDQLRSKYQKALQSSLSKSTERLELIRMLRDISSKVTSAAKDYKIAVAEAERAEAIGLKLKAMVAEVKSSGSQIEQIEFEAIVLRNQADLEQYKERCARFRQSLIDLAGLEVFTKFEQSLKPEPKHVI